MAVEEPTIRTREYYAWQIRGAKKRFGYFNSYEEAVASANVHMVDLEQDYGIEYEYDILRVGEVVTYEVEVTVVTA